MCTELPLVSSGTDNYGTCLEKREMKDGHLEYTGERYLPEIGGTTGLEHVHRYLVARELAKGKNVLDLACGEGYGSSMLAENARHVCGVDIAPEAIIHATQKYRKENLQYLVGSCTAIPLTDDSIDLVVSFETIEHIKQHQEMMQEIKRVLHPNGILIMSSPDRHEFTDIGHQGTHYHVKELYRDEFEKLIERFFSCSVFLGQRVLYGSAILSEYFKFKSTTYLQNESNFRGTSGVPRPLYMLAVASDEKIPEFSGGIFEIPVQESDAVRQINDEYTQLRHTMGERNATIERLHHKIDECEAVVEALTKENKEYEDHMLRLKRQLDEILKSRTWRIISLLRSMNKNLFHQGR